MFGVLGFEARVFTLRFGMSVYDDGQLLASNHKKKNDEGRIP